MGKFQSALTLQTVYNKNLMNDILESRQEGRLLRVWLNRPEKRNALTVELCRELAHTLERFTQCLCDS